MSDTNTDIDALRLYLNETGTSETHRYRRALTALVAERDALRKRVSELEAHPPANRDLHERLVCAIWPEIMREWREHGDASDWRGWARLDALEEADKMVALIREQRGGTC